ncbi:MAG TPA: hypothetical protein DCW29_09395 [Janthinobacterium sp.]|nr:hypothetical protein [Janthinobacterium sp.]
MALAALAALSLLLAAPPTTAGAAAVPKRILFLTAYGYGRAGVESFTRSYVAELKAGGLGGEDVMVEYLNLNRDDGPLLRERMRELLLLRYAARKPDLIVALQAPALAYLLGPLKDLSRDTPLLAVSGSAAADAPAASAAPAAPAPAVAHVWRQSGALDVAGTLRQALALFPATRRVVVALGAGEADQDLKRSTQAAAAAWGGKLEFDYLDGLSLAQMKRRVAALPPGSILLCGSVNRDRDGVPTTPLQLAAELTRVANAPAFALYNNAVGSGVVGGSVLHLGHEARRLARTSLAMLAGARPPEAPLEPVRYMAMYDWNELARWGADPARLPADAVFVNRPASLWSQHRDAVLSALAVFLALSALLATLLLQRRRLRLVQAHSHDSEERFRTLVEHAPEAILVYDVDLERFVDGNTRAERMLGCDRAYLLACRPTDIYPDEQPDGLAPAVSIAANIARALAGEQIVIERNVRRRDGSIFPCDVWLVRLPARGRRLLRSGFLESSERKRAEQELLGHRAHLEELVQQRTAALSVAVREAETANRAKSVFLANMSHELRTPLNAVIGFSQLMTDAPAIPAAERDNLAIINRAGHHLLTLINDILELSKVEAGQMRLHLSTIDLDQLLRETLEMARGRSTVPVRLECDALPALVRADGAKLRQVLLNLLSNAVKSVRGGAVTLSLRVAALPEERLALSFAVRDSGVGIAAADREAIFEPFVQVGPARTGTGLGLSISREFVRLMGGELTLESEPGVGSVFSFTLTAELRRQAPAPRGQGAAVRTLAPSQRGKRLLLVDDDADCRHLLTKLLAPLGFEIAEADDGAAAVAVLEAAAPWPDLLLMDWRMPLMDGLALTRWVRARGERAQPRIVIMTASAFEEEKTAALAAGADAFLRKPIEHAKLFAILERQLGLRFTRAEAAPAPDAAAADAAAEAPLLPADLARLPEPARRTLMRAVRDLDLGRTGAALAEIAAQRPQLAARIGDMLAQQQYLDLWQLLQEAGAVHAGAPHGEAPPN